MKIFKSVTLSIISTSLLLSSTISLEEKAKKNGLIPIPDNKVELLKIIDPKGVITPERIELGKQLYFEPRLSKSSLISCNWCHNLGLGGVDGVSKAIGHQWTGNPMHLNSPTVYNAVFAKRQFWDGRSPSLEDQAGGPIQAGPEMAAPKELVVKRVNSIPEYIELFKKAYGENVKITFEKIASTIAIFERTLVTPSRYDDFLNGKKDALSDKEKEGLELFIDKGCITCHKGIALGGDMQPFELREKYKYRATGGFSGNSNKMVKVPTLRNITETAPYFHNGMIWNLRDAIKEMSNIQVGFKVAKKDEKGKISVDIQPISLTEKDIDKIRLFFNALEGRKAKIEYPQLPKSRGNTPRPDAK
ncbi:Cytochrome c551 peroxidase [hydrothermal vent metagenome]|uniref:Cytochrome c551 peroxidase n=1 Tax=hydrothermal vent metagenome TaxID=652676 RepID=A0A1W1BI07_9ZZZZ